MKFYSSFIDSFLHALWNPCYYANLSAIAEYLNIISSLQMTLSCIYQNRVQGNIYCFADVHVMLVDMEIILKRKKKFLDIEGIGWSATEF